MQEHEETKDQSTKTRAVFGHTMCRVTKIRPDGVGPSTNGHSCDQWLRKHEARDVTHRYVIQRSYADMSYTATSYTATSYTDMLYKAMSYTDMSYTDMSVLEVIVGY